MELEPYYIDAVNSLANTRLGVVKRGEAYHRCSTDPDVGVVWKEGFADLPTEEEIQTELVRLKAEWVTKEYARNRAPEYPTIAELTIALYDTDDKAAHETKRAAVKTKWPKDNSGPIE